MKLRTLRLRLFRSIASEVDLALGSGLTIVGPNNSGKSNLLRAVQMFFTGRQNRLGYSREYDLTFGAGSKRTSMVMTFEFQGGTRDRTFVTKYNRLAEAMGIERMEGDRTFPVYLEFSAGSNPNYKLFPSKRRPKGAAGAKYSRLLGVFIDELIENRFEVIYVPSDKDFKELFAELALPFACKLVARSLSEQIEHINSVLSEASQAITDTLSDSGISVAAHLGPPSGDYERLIGPVELLLSDPHPTSVYSKGMGIQAAVLLSTLRWIDQQLRAEGRDVVWLIEEPEAFLHPELAASCGSILRELGSVSQVLRTTHSLSFVPDDPRLVVGTKLDGENTTIQRYRTSREAGEHIRANLGVCFSDFFSLGRYNIGVEGASDREMIRWVLAFFDDTFLDGRQGIEVLYSEECRIVDFGGAKPLESFLLANYGQISKERAFVSLFDGDDAGRRAVQALRGYFGNKDVEFELSENYVFARSGFGVEGLFPDPWTIAIHDMHPKWFSDFQQDVSGELIAFRYHDNKKANAMQLYLGIAEQTEPANAWIERWDSLFRALADAVVTLDERLQS